MRKLKFAELTVKVPVGVKRFVEALGEFTGRDTWEYLTKALVQGVLDSVNPDCEGVKALDFEAIKEKYGF